MDFGQTRYQSHATGKQITLPFPEKTLLAILEAQGLDIRRLTRNNIAGLFPKLVGMWLDGTVQTEELSSIANYFLTITGYDDRILAGRLMDASELSYYIRHTNHESGEPLHGFVSRLRDYYEQAAEKAS